MAARKEGLAEGLGVAALALGAGVVGADRYMLLPMFPTLRRQLKFGYQDVGVITGSLALAYGIAAVTSGPLCARVGRRRVVVISALTFSLLVGATGLATGLLSFCLLRAMMGFADGAYMTSAIATNGRISPPSRRGRNIGLQLMALPLFGLTLSPLLVTQLLPVIGWRWIFLGVMPVGLAATLMLRRALLSPDAPADLDPPGAAAKPMRWADLFGYRNVQLCMVGMLCWLAASVTLSALLPSYLIDRLHLPVRQMGFILAATGLGGAGGNLVLPRLSDRLGRKPVVLGASVAAAILIAAFMNAPGVPVLLFALQFLISACLFTLIALTVGPLATEGVPAALATSATGLVVCFGEIAGGGLAPMLGGFVAQRFGIEHFMILPLAAIALGLVAYCFLEGPNGGRGRNAWAGRAPRSLAA